MLDKVLLVIVELLPILYILSEVDFFGCPEGSFLVFIHLPNIVVLDWEENESIGVLFKKWLWKRSLSLTEALRLRGNL